MCCPISASARGDQSPHTLLRTKGSLTEGKEHSAMANPSLCAEFPHKEAILLVWGIDALSQH